MDDMTDNLLPDDGPEMETVRDYQDAGELEGPFEPDDELTQEEFESILEGKAGGTGGAFRFVPPRWRIPTRLEG